MSLNEKISPEVILGPGRVELTYRHETDDPLVSEIARLVSAEQNCCGAAGVEFKVTPTDNGSLVTIETIRDGLPAQTVLAAFADMEVK